MNELEDALRKRFGAVQKKLLDSATLAFMGDGSGALAVAGMPGHVWVRIDNAPAIPVFNKVASVVNNAAVLVGYNPLEPNLLQVLSAWQGGAPASFYGTGVTPSMVGPHGSSHFFWGPDPTFVDKRQILAGRIGPASSSGSSTAEVEVWPDVPFVAGAPRVLTHQYLDLAAYVPTSGSSRWVCVSGSASGSGVVLVVTSGSLTAGNAPAWATLPNAPDGQVVLGFVRLYGGMTALAEGLAADGTTPVTDILDARSMLPPTGGYASAAPQYLTLATTVGLPNQRKLVAGTNISFIDGGAGGNLTINSSGSGSGSNVQGHVIQISGSALTAEPNLNFTGNGVVEIDDPGNNATKVTIAGKEVYSSGSVMPYQVGINFAGAGVTVQDASGSGWTLVTVAAGSSGSQIAGHVVYNSGSAMAQRAGLNFAGTGVAVTDVSGSGWTLVTITAGSSGSSLAGHVIQASGSPMPQEANLNFTGAGVVVADIAGSATRVTIAGASVSGSAASAKVAFGKFGATNTLDYDNLFSYDNTYHQLGIQVATPNSTLQVGGSFSASRQQVGNGYTLDYNDYTVEITSSGSSIITLPSAATCSGRIYVLKNTVSMVLRYVKIVTTSSQYIDAAQFYLFTSQWECITVQSNGTNWNIIGKVT